MIVMKFGGSSLESPSALARVVSIVKSFRGDSPVVVVSAIGKTTDRLLRIGRLAAEGKIAAALGEIRDLDRFHSEFGAFSDEISSSFESVRGLTQRITAERVLSPINVDALLSHGERLSSLVVAEALRSAGVPSVHLRAEKLIVTDDCHTKATPLVWETCAKLRRAIPLERSGEVAVMGGFIGATESGVPTTLGRGGSDFTAALVGAAINAEEVQIWTDVDGMLSCDPRVTKGARCLRGISYREAAEMAEWGAKVLHPATVAPAWRQRIPMTIRNSRNAECPGTRIEAVQPARHEGLVKSIAYLKDVTLLRIFPAGRDITAQFRVLVQSIFLKHRTAFRPMNAKNAIEVAVSDCPCTAALFDELSDVGRVVAEGGLAAVSLIGKGIDSNQGLLAHASKTLCARSIAFHARETAPMRITFLVAEQELELAAEGLHDEFVKFQENGPFYREFETQRSRQKVAVRGLLLDKAQIFAS
jgi:aspartate kinase